MVDGQTLSGIMDVRVSVPHNFRLGQFSFVKAFTPDDPFPVSWWAATQTKSIFVSIDLSNEGTVFQNVISGYVDDHQYDPIENFICVAGRDLGAPLCDERIVSTYRNQTASQIAEKLAAAQGLASSITATSTLVGRYYDTDHDETYAGDFSLAANQWDLLCRLGAEEGITPYIQGQTLYFNPMPVAPEVFSVQLAGSGGGLAAANVTALRLERHLLQANDVVVKVESWNSRKKASLSASIRTRKGDAGADEGGVRSQYLIVAPNLTQAQCIRKATRVALDCARYEREVSLTAPAFQFLGPQAVIQVTGTGTDYDQRYYPNLVMYCLDYHGGARTEMVARASSGFSLYDDETGQQISSS